LGFIDKIVYIISNNAYRVALGLLCLLFLLFIPMYFVPPVSFVIDPHTITANITDENESFKIISIKNIGINLTEINFTKEGPVNISFDYKNISDNITRDDTIFLKVIINPPGKNEIKGEYRGIIRFRANTSPVRGLGHNISQKRPVIESIPVKINVDISKKSIKSNATPMSNTTITNLTVANLTVNNLTILKQNHLVPSDSNQ
jgi:hypothetical protein